MPSSNRIVNAHSGSYIYFFEQYFGLGCTQKPSIATHNAFITTNDETNHLISHLGGSIKSNHANHMNIQNESNKTLAGQPDDVLVSISHFLETKDFLNVFGLLNCHLFIKTQTKSFFKGRNASITFNKKTMKHMIENKTMDFFPLHKCKVIS